MTDDDPIAAYLRDVDALLDTSDPQRHRVLSEIDGHLRDSAAEHAVDGASSAQAAAQAINEFGPPHVVAAGFATNPTSTPRVRGVRRWLPAALPAACLVLSGVLLIWSLTWLPSGRTAGQQHAQQIYLRSAATAFVLLLGAVWAIHNADRDQRWRLAAWSCTALAALLLMV